MRILQTNFHTKWGGQAAAIFHLARALASRGHDMTIAAPPGSNLAERATEAGLDVFDRAHFQARGSFTGLFYDARQLQRLMRSRGFDVIHTNGSKDGWAASAALYSVGLPSVTIRTRHNLKRIRRHLGNRWFHGRATDHVVAVSNAIRNHTIASNLCPPDKVTVIHPALDLDAFQPKRVSRQCFRTEIGASDGQLLIGTSARLEQQKGIDLLLRGFARIARHEPNALLVIAGDGKEQMPLMQLAHELGISARVCFCGFRADVPSVLAGLDLFALPSRTEGFGIAIVEAMAMGLPVVASRVGGVLDIITNGLDGVLVPLEDIEALTTAILELLHNPEARRRLGLAARQRAQVFSPQAAAQQHEALYERLIREKKR